MIKKPRPKAFKYFKVELSKTSYGLFCLRVHRLIKKKEAVMRGYAPMNQYRFVAEMRDVSERDAQCLTMALESPRVPLKNNAEVLYWKKKVKALAKG